MTFKKHTFEFVFRFERTDDQPLLLISTITYVRCFKFQIILSTSKPSFSRSGFRAVKRLVTCLRPLRNRRRRTRNNASSGVVRSCYPFCVVNINTSMSLVWQAKQFSQYRERFHNCSSLIPKLALLGRIYFPVALV